MPALRQALNVVRHFTEPLQMKKLTFKIVIPLTVISFATFTKWWYAIPIDAPDTMFRGFPFAFTCQGWHTSMSLQIFLMEFFFDILIYFLCWFTILFCIDKFLIKVKTNKILTFCLWTISLIFICFGTLIVSNKGNLFYAKRPFEMKVLETGYEFIWQDTKQTDFYKYFPKDK
jgi:hypothetical protein